MASSDDLIQNVYTYFLNAYRQAAPGASGGGELVAFEAIGFSPGCSGLTGTGAAITALGEISGLADWLPRIDGGIYIRTMQTISGKYCTVLDEAEPSSASSILTFSDMKARAKKAYDDAGTVSLGLKPTYPMPIDWYDLTNAANWTSYSYHASAQAPPGVPPAPVAPNVHLEWHILPQELRPLVLQRPIDERPPMNVARPMFMRAPTVANEAIAANVAAPAAASVPVAPATLVHPIELTALASVANIATQTAPQPVETPKFSMSFDYCLIQLRRPWLSGDLLATPGWYVPGARSGDYASGGPANTGAFAVIPTAFIAVKNLVIEAAWSESDANAGGNAAAFGPFSLLGRSTNDKGALLVPGLQVIAWICSVQPQLPPDTDPLLPSPPVTPPASGGGTH